MTLLNPTLIYLGSAVTWPLIGGLFNFFFCRRNPEKGAYFSTCFLFLALFLNILSWIFLIPFLNKVKTLGFYADTLSYIMATLILFISGIIHQFSLNYMKGDRNFRSYFLLLNLTTIGTLCLVASDNFFLFIFFWLMSHISFVFLMIHKKEWIPAKNSGYLALKNFIFSATCFLIAFVLFFQNSQTYSIQDLIAYNKMIFSNNHFVALLFLILAVLIQSGSFPFHKWILSSLNSPTPISALMHAGLINSSGVILARFSNLSIQEPMLLNLLFVFSLITIILSSFWKLIQPDIKKMLAASTISQLAFMLMQCSLGLFSSAIAHLVSHGLFKAYLFLRTGSAAKEVSHLYNEPKPKLFSIYLSLFIGLLGGLGFIYSSGGSYFSLDTRWVLVFFAWLAASQIALLIFQKNLSFALFMIACLISSFSGLVYGLTVHSLDHLLIFYTLSKPIQLNLLHIFGIILLGCLWLLLNCKYHLRYENSPVWSRIYVFLLNQSQPDKKTLSSERALYKF
jgi:NAD(P)H-quinone oxidoreductase subunit 5